jgi:hypothetical protein
MIVCGLRAGHTMKEIKSYGNINKSTVFYDVERKFEKFIASGGSADTVLTGRKRTVRGPGRQPGQAHHQGPRQVPPPSAGDEHFQNKYETIVSKDALT